MPGQNSLNNFYQSVKHRDEAFAASIKLDVAQVALHALSADNTPGKEAADRLRRAAFDLPVVLQRVLESALTDLGY